MLTRAANIQATSHSKTVKILDTVPKWTKTNPQLEVYHWSEEPIKNNQLNKYRHREPAVLTEN